MDSPDVLAKLRYIKKYGYDVNLEEAQLKSIERDIQKKVGQDKISKKLKTFGSLHVKDLPKFEEV